MGIATLALYLLGANYAWDTLPAVFPLSIRDPGKRAVLTIFWPVLSLWAILVDAYARWRTRR